MQKDTAVVAYVSQRANDRLFTVKVYGLSGQVHIVQKKPSFVHSLLVSSSVGAVRCQSS